MEIDLFGVRGHFRSTAPLNYKALNLYTLLLNLFISLDFYGHMKVGGEYNKETGFLRGGVIPKKLDGRQSTGNFVASQNISLLEKVKSVGFMEFAFSLITET